MMIVVRCGYNDGPGNRVSFNEYPDDVLADASQTARRCVVVLEGFKAP